MISALLGILAKNSAGGGGATGTPLNYDNSLRHFLDAENGVTTSGVNVTQWVDQDIGNTFSVPGGGRSPVFDSNTQNGLPGVNFQQPVGQLFLNRKLTDAASSLDNHFGSNVGVERASIAFAGRLNRITDSQFNVSNTICSKGYRVSGGWDLQITSQGSIRFRQRRANGSTWQIQASGFYNVGDLVLGYINYDGGNKSGSGFFRLFDGNNFVTVGTVSVGTNSGIGSDAPDDLVLGNIRDPNDANANAPFQGPIFGIWFTRPAANFLDENYLRRWLVT